MLVAPMMPTTPLLNHKRKLSSRLASNSSGIHLPSPKRPHLDSEITVKERLAKSEVNLKSGNDRQHTPIKMVLGHGTHVSPQLPPIRRAASVKAEQQLSLLFKDSSLSPASVSNGLESVFPQVPESDLSKNNVYLKRNEKPNGIPSEVFTHHVRNEASTLDNGVGEIPVVKLKKKGVMRSEIPTVTSSDVDSDCSESGRMSIPKSNIKQPAIVLVKMNQPKKKVSASPSSHPISPEVSSVVYGGYVHRMASLNARACVAAYLEPERKFSPKYASHGQYKKTAKSKATGDSAGDTTSKLSSVTVSKVEPPRSKPVVLKVNGVENVIPVIKFEGNGIEIPACAVIVEEVDGSGEDEVSYNKIGLLYNGDTLHPNAQVFLTGDHELQLPSRVLPTLVPARLSTVKRAVRKAASTGVLHVDKKRTKVKEAGCSCLCYEFHTVGTDFVDKYTHLCNCYCRKTMDGVHLESQSK